ncbi:MAG: prepilin-type N-terminal cleavage/methylation domain-containing protein [Proteobacteria bacterium]|nr:prepilin-type N-terminal cleavage/methylation domain-containing protein [Pseudomonadota bacterium]
MRNRIRTGRSGKAGFTLIEMMIVVVLIGIFAALASPIVNGFFLNIRAKAAARSVADALRLARTDAIRTGSPHIVFFSAAAAGDPPATDPAGTALGTDPTTGGPFPIFILRDNAAGASNCRIDAGEDSTTVAAQRDIAWGSAVSGGTVLADDTGLVDHSSGSSFRTAAGASITWVMFLGNGLPVGFDAACNVDTVGTAGGAIYLTNGRRDYAIALSPLGAVRVHAFDLGASQWTK